MKELNWLCISLLVCFAAMTLVVACGDDDDDDDDDYDDDYDDDDDYDYDDDDDDDDDDDNDDDGCCYWHASAGDVSMTPAGSQEQCEEYAGSAVQWEYVPDNPNCGDESKDPEWW